jgi:hypothetical protein
MTGDTLSTACAESRSTAYSGAALLGVSWMYDRYLQQQKGGYGQKEV